MDALSLEHISMNYLEPHSETKAISDISFSVASGEFVSIVGPSGCGKSTLLSIASGLIKPTSGKVLFQGIPAEQSSSHLGYMLQKDHLFPWRNIAENVTLGLEIRHILTPENEQYAYHLLEKYGLLDFKHHYPSQLSGGMRQRAALIRTLATKPDILLLDEPFSALDYQTRLYVADEIAAIIQEEGKTALLVTHDISEAISMSDRIVVLTHRPSQVVAIHDICLDTPGKTPMKARQAPEFRNYFDLIWKELDVHA